MIVKMPAVAPRLYQVPLWSAFQRGIRFIVHTWPRRSGKDLVDFSSMVCSAIKRPGNYYYMFPTRAWAQRALWDNLPDWTGGRKLVDVLCPDEIVAKKNNSDFYIDLRNGSRIKIDGTDNLNFVGQGGSGYVLSEFQSHKDEVTGFLAPILREGKAPVIFNGTLRGKDNQLWQRYEDNIGRPGWFTQWYTLEHTKTDYWYSEENGIFINTDLIGKKSPYTGAAYSNVQDEVDAGLISLLKAKQEYLNLPVDQSAGAYYTREISVMEGENRVGAVWDGVSPVYTFWDLGGDKEESDTTAIAFAVMNKYTKSCEIVDYYENSGKLRGHYFDVLKSRPYRYGGHYIPHDGKRSNTWTGEGMAETAKRLFGIEMRYIPKADSVQNEIEVVRRDFVNFNINKQRCGTLFEHLTKYHENETTGRECHRNNCAQCHGASHGADTVRLMSMARYLNLVEPYLEKGRVTLTPQIIEDTWVIV